MKKVFLVITGLIIISTCANSQRIVKGGKFNPEKIKIEITEKFNAFNGKFIDQTVEMWDSYFLNSPNIGNMHEGHPEIGWDKFHDGNIKFVEGKYEGEMRFENLEVHPISSNLAWVKGEMISEIGEKTYKSIFHDSLVKTTEGWRVVLSVVSLDK